MIQHDMDSSQQMSEKMEDEINDITLAFSSISSASQEISASAETLSAISRKLVNNE
ncbi:hypothetical protein ACFYKX_21335 [Cytobacillus sp. FJAT-54145]|uniref:Methyl-accepting chemotaxis protein n=1 Tax=Cytobacillus spartinae TaxID=3299023 RepID=A0ABW6KJU0_9BACI